MRAVLPRSGLDDRSHDPARADDAQQRRWIGVIGLANTASGIGFALLPCPARSCAPPRARGRGTDHLGAGGAQALGGELLLASASPRRRAILTQLGVRFRAVAVEVEEVEDGDPHDVARGNAARKARAGLAGAGPADTVLAADTVVALDARILPKPRDSGQARDWLLALSGREHLVVSAVCVARHGTERAAASATTVRFRRLTEAEIDWYVRTGEWRGKAGGYAIQGRGAALVAGISGDYWTVVGLPVPVLVELLGPEFLTAS